MRRSSFTANASAVLGLARPVGLTSIQDEFSAPDGTVLIFGLSAPVNRAALNAFERTMEASECMVVNAPANDLAFPLHTEVVSAYFKRHANLGLEGAPLMAGPWAGVP